MSQLIAVMVFGVIVVMICSAIIDRRQSLFYILATLPFRGIKALGRLVFKRRRTRKMANTAYVGAPATRGPQRKRSAPSYRHGSIQVGVTPTGNPLEWDLSTATSILIAGGGRSGKTALATAILAQCGMQGGDIYIYSDVSTDYDRFENHEHVQLARTANEFQVLINNVKDVIALRLLAQKQGTTGPDDHKPCLVVVDAYNNYLSAIQNNTEVPGEESENGTYDEAALWDREAAPANSLMQLVTLGPKVNVHLVLVVGLVTSAVTADPVCKAIRSRIVTSLMDMNSMMYMFDGQEWQYSDYVEGLYYANTQPGGVPIRCALHINPHVFYETFS
ncbi:hypothetical protein [Ferrimicrobium acidiphilum]|uniref:hypothetical protein n=1 Tax=Ferrimicrobium acidiphilum TaxID=121039 RepID=UPI0023F1DDA7|nr:hypothetical protein [Ferrimicrobium acidiphilum]